MLYAEALLFLDGPSRSGESAALMAHAMAQTRSVPREVLEALGNTWPLDIAARQFEDTTCVVPGWFSLTPGHCLPLAGDLRFYPAGSLPRGGKASGQADQPGSYCDLRMRRSRRVMAC